MTSGDAFEIVPLDRKIHDRAAFSCGKEPLDNYIIRQAGQDLSRGVAAVFVATRPNSQQVLGYYTLSQANVPLESIPATDRKRLPRYPNIPVTLLGRLAVDSTTKGAGLGATLLGDACRRAASVASDVASVGIIVEAIDDDAMRFYEHFGFVKLDKASNRLMLPMTTILNELGGQ